MQQLMDARAQYPNALAPIVLNGCLTAAALFSGEIARTRLLMTLLGSGIAEMNINFEHLITTLDEAILDIGPMTSLHEYQTRNKGSKASTTPSNSTIEDWRRAYSAHPAASRSSAAA